MHYRKSGARSCRWVERIERYDKGKPVSLLFDMEGYDVSTVDMELELIYNHIIHVFKNYYPNFLNYIFILGIAWILNAVFKVIKTMHPEKADNYVLVFEPEEREITYNPIAVNNNKKVHFADRSPPAEYVPNLGDKPENYGNILKVTPTCIITFVKEGNKLISRLQLQNLDNIINLAYKMKTTTSREKFRAHPSAGCIPPGGTATVTITLLHGFQLGGISKDKFLVMSMPVESVDLSVQELIDLWKNTFKYEDISAQFAMRL